MTSTQVLLVLFVCIILVQVSFQEKENESFAEKKKALLKFIEGLESSLQHQEQEKREMEVKKKREEEMKRKVETELDKLKQEEELMNSDKVIGDVEGGKRACGNRLSAGKCQLLRWFGKGCTGKKMMVNCRASCGLC